MKLMTTLRCVIATLAVSVLLGCSGQALKRAGYESLHNISDRRNADDPKYDPGQRPSFETYQQRREEILREERPATDQPLTPPTPAGP